LAHLLDEEVKLGEGEKLVIAIDALDEVDLATQKDGTNILYLPSSLPEGVYFLLTRRRVTLPFVVHAPQHLLNLMEYTEQSRGNAQEYIQCPKLRASIDKPQKSAEELANKSENNFMYLCCATFSHKLIEQSFFR
jgi:hypothetical protein